MNKSWIKKLVAAFLFIISVFIVDMIINRGNTEVTMDMPKATLPVVSVISEGYKINTMYGYYEKRDEIYMKDNITPINSSRELTIAVDSYGETIDGISYEVRSLDGERLIERKNINNFQKSGEELRFQVEIKDLIEENREYVFVTIVTMKDGKKAYYYTRFIEKEEYFLKEKLDYVLNFHNITLSSSEGDEIRRYLESNSKGDNSNFNKVTINSSLKQVMWDELIIKKVREPQILIRDITKDTAMVVLKYLVMIDPGVKEQYGFVEEYYRVRYTPNRMYLLNYERSLEEIFQPSKDTLTNDKIPLGITSEDIEIMESEGGANLAFVSADRLYSYSSNDNRFTEVFSFYNKENMDERTNNKNFKIKILKIEDSGNITFCVYGYMNRGVHEGEVGISVYYFDYMGNTIEELIFLPYNKSEQILMEELNNLLYLNTENHLFLILEGELHDINISEKTQSVVMEGLSKERYIISGSGRMICWSSTEEINSATKLQWMNLSQGTIIEVRAGYDEYIKALGFMEEDLVYGLAKRDKVKKEENGKILFPMYKALIKNKEEKILKEYKKEGVYITDCKIEGNQITLERIKEVKENQYQKEIDDHISNNNMENKFVNVVSRIKKDKYKTTTQITLKNTINPSTLKIMNPKEVIFEGGRELVFEIEDEKRFYVYGPYGLHKVTPSSSEAVSEAYKISGTVLNENGSYIWKKERQYTKNQIMAINGKKREKEISSLATCLDTILLYEGISLKTQERINKGEDAYGILTEILRDEKIIDLTGCELESLLYYMDQDIPILALMGEGEAYLLIGFNEQNVVLMDPVSGTIYKKGKNDSAEMFAKNGNQFITYVRVE